MAWQEEAKEDIIRRAEARMDYFLQQMRDRPQLTGLYVYWFHWYRTRRADWQTRLWLEQLRGWKREIRSWQRAEEHLDRGERIRKNVEAVQDGMVIIRQELDDTRREARVHDWRIRFPKPQQTMARWISFVSRRYRTLRYWINLILEELPRPWIDFVFVIYYAYTSPGAERHLEAHFEGKCQRNEKIQQKVKEFANKLLRLWVASPTVTPEGKEKPGYAVPLLQSEMAKPPYEGHKVSGQNLWEWGIQYGAKINYSVLDKRIKKAEPTIESREKVTLRLELMDYDYAQLRKYNEYEVPAVWWELSFEELKRLLGL